ncbi:helix-turn-helix domain-containing protein [Amycolatopsis sp. CA-230715]|uniref:helix-turn-helix domain-containing protein n=1 Tax=Amycolatopsis sp. CA-230715 TaxID=2745196 RepID=UPI001C00B06B|nr:XRE family transcriptional regulator [Amycolatopsis sp. CA-230715]
MARDRKSEHCRGCTRRLISDAAQPQPATFWHADSIRAALTARHFGQLFAAYRHEHKPHVSQARLGLWIGLTQAQVSRLEAPGARAPGDLYKLQRWATALHVPTDLLWFPVFHTSNESAYSAAEASLDDVQRRQFFKTARAGVTAIGASLLATPATATTVVKPRSTDAEIVRHMTETFRQLDNRFGGGHSRGTTSITSYLTSSVTPMLNDPSGTAAAREELFAAAAELHQVAGWSAYDVGDTARGQRYLADALTLSQDAGDDALEAEMLAAMSHHAAFTAALADHTPSDTSRVTARDTALDMALAARRTATRSGLAALHAEAAVLEAHGHALKSNTPACFAALREAERAFERFTPGGGPQWLSYFDSAYLSAKFAHTLRDLGHLPEAEQFARRSLGMSDGYDRGRLFNTALLASILAGQGHVDEACAEATTAVRMCQRVRSVRGSAYLADVARRLAPVRSDRRVRAVYAEMRAVGVPTPG